MTTTIRAVAILLDMDGTLVDSTAVVERVWADWAATHGLDLATVLDVVHGRQGHESMAILLPHRTEAENRADDVRLLARQTTELDGVVEVLGAAELLRGLGDTPHALVTSATMDLATARMAAAGLPLPPVAISAERVSASKPDPEGFLAAATALRVEPADCVVFEDSEAGIAAAKAAGMRVVGVGETDAARGADWSIPDLSGVEVWAENGIVSLTLP